MSNSSSFDPTYYYRFFNNADQNATLSSGVDRDTDGAVNMTAIRFSASENWQLYYQSGRYFIRNYDYGPDWQLGLTDNSRVVPSLLTSSGDIGQQWNLSQWSDGTWKFTNELLGDGFFLQLAHGNKVPAMDTGETGSNWDVEINVSAGQVTDPAMLSPVSNMENPPTSTSISSPPTTTATSTSTSKSASAATITHTPSSAAHSGKSLSGGAIAGIVIGCVAGVVLLLLAWFVFRRRRNRRRDPASAPDVSSTTQYTAMDQAEYPKDGITRGSKYPSEIEGDLPHSAELGTHEA